MRKLQGKVISRGFRTADVNGVNRSTVYRVEMEVSFQDFPHINNGDHILMEVCCGKPDSHDAA